MEYSEEMRRQLMVTFRAGLLFYFAGAVIYFAAALYITATEQIIIPGPPSDPLLRVTLFIFMGCISLLFLGTGARYYKKGLREDRIEIARSAALFYGLMGIPFAAGMGSMFFLLGFHRTAEPEPQGNRCPTCGGFIVLDAETGVAFCSRCNKKF